MKKIVIDKVAPEWWPDSRLLDLHDLHGHGVFLDIRIFLRETLSGDPFWRWYRPEHDDEDRTG